MKKIITKRFATILGITLIVMVLTSGPVLATWYYAIQVENYRDCTHPEYALSAPDYKTFASLGINDSAEGWIILDLGVDIGMESYQPFTVYSSSTVKETYNLTLISDMGTKYWPPWTGLDDTKDNYLNAPYISGDVWRYVEIHTESGQGSTTHDPAFGSEIDAVGFER